MQEVAHFNAFSGVLDDNIRNHYRVFTQKYYILFIRIGLIVS